MLSPVMFFVCVMLFIDAFNMFNEVYIITGGGPDNSTITLSMYIYFYAFEEFNFGLKTNIDLTGEITGNVVNYKCNIIFNGYV